MTYGGIATRPDRQTDSPRTAIGRIARRHDRARGGTWVSPSTIRNQIDQLERDGVVTGYRAIVDYSQTELTLETVLVCTAEIKDRATITNKVRNVPNVVNVRELHHGTDNVIVKIVCASAEELTQAAIDLTDHGFEVGDKTLVKTEYIEPHTAFSRDWRQQTHENGYVRVRRSEFIYSPDYLVEALKPRRLGRGYSVARASNARVKRIRCPTDVRLFVDAPVFRRVSISHKLAVDSVFASSKRKPVGHKPTENNHVTPSPEQERSNGCVAPPPVRRTRNRNSPTEPPVGGRGKPRRLRRGGCHCTRVLG
jgi:Lrp/AsnC family transcriptional regulator, leucine-responsive regulatory protein